MKVYRAIEFSKLIFLLDEDAQPFWDYQRSKREQSRPTDSINFNWWLDPGFQTERRQVIAHIAKPENKGFFEKSIQYNAMQGGRFNPTRSFGVLYCATDPTVAALEVLYHLFSESFPIYSGMKKSSNKIGSSFNMKIPERMNVLIPVFEIELSPNAKPYRLCDDVPGLTTDCQKVGFRRYIGNNFSRDFIFGNDYEISRILGCHLHTQEKSSFFVPSARVDFETQDQLSQRNLIIPEKDFDETQPRLSGRFREYRCEVGMEQIGKRGHRVMVEVCGDGTSATHEIWLQPNPTKKGNDLQTIKYAPDTGTIKEKHVYSRVVQVQKFHIPNASDLDEDA